MGRRIFSFGDPDLKWRENGEGRQFLKATHPMPDGTSAENRFIAHHGDRGIEGYIDHARFSFIDVAFEEEGTSSDLEDRANAWRDRAWSALTHFVQAYRVTADEPDVPVPVKSDSPLSDLFVADEYEFGPDGWEGKFMSAGIELAWRPPEVTGLLKGVLSPDRGRRFSGRLDIDQPIPIYLQLLADAREESVFHENHPMAVVLAATASEVFVQERIRDECEARSIDKLPYGKEGGTRAAQEAIAAGNIKEDLLGSYMTLLTGPGFRSRSAYQRWHADTYEVRNEVIHRGRWDIGGSEARAAFEGAVGLMQEADRVLAQTRPV